MMPLPPRLLLLHWTNCPFYLCVSCSSAVRFTLTHGTSSRVRVIFNKGNCALAVSRCNDDTRTRRENSAGSFYDLARHGCHCSSRTNPWFNRTHSYRRTRIVVSVKFGDRFSPLDPLNVRKTISWHVILEKTTRELRETGIEAGGLRGWAISSPAPPPKLRTIRGDCAGLHEDSSKDTN